MSTDDENDHTEAGRGERREAELGHSHPSLHRLYQSRCKFCRFGLEHREIATFIETQLYFGRTTYREAKGLLLKEFSFEVDEKSLRNHIKDHIPIELDVIRTSMANSMDRVKSASELAKENIAILEAMKYLGYLNLITGKHSVEPRTLLRAVELQQKMMPGIVVEGNTTVLLPPEFMKKIVDILYEFVPGPRHIEFRERVEEELYAEAREAAFKTMARGHKNGLL